MNITGKLMCLSFVIVYIDQKTTCCFVFKLRFTPCKTGKLLQDMELQEKEEQKD